MNNINILHLSDLHVGNKAENGTIITIDQVIDNLCKHLISVPEEWKPNYLCISGDIAFRGWEEDYNEAAKLLKKILESIHLDSSKIIIAPGNHDKDLVDTKICREINDDRKADEKAIKNAIESNVNGNITKEINASFTNFNKFCSTTLKLPPYTSFLNDNYTFGIRTFEEDKLIFVVLNSCWLAFSGIGDLGRLYLGNRIINSIKNDIEKINGYNEYTIITVMHHGINWFRWDERFNGGKNTVQSVSILEDFSDILLTGHEHGNIIHPDMVGCKTLVFSGGASFTNPDKDEHFYANNCSILKIDSSDYSIKRMPLIYSSTVGSTYPTWDIKNVGSYYLSKGIKKLEDEIARHREKERPKNVEELIPQNDDKTDGKIKTLSRNEILSNKLKGKTGSTSSNLLNALLELRTNGILEKKPKNDKLDTATAQVSIRGLNNQILNIVVSNCSNLDSSKVISELIDNCCSENELLNIYFYTKRHELLDEDQIIQKIQELRVKYKNKIVNNKLVLNEPIILEI